MAQHHKIGALDLMAVDDGILKMQLDMILGFPLAEAGRLTQADAGGSLSISVNNYVFRRPGATVLIDAGAADTMGSTLGKLPANLAAAGIAPAEITHILLTHLHPDHANGLVDAGGAAVFPNAEILVAAEEHDFWLGEDGANDHPRLKDVRSRNRQNLAPYTARTRRLRDGEEVLGCVPILAPGHSPGHTCWRVETGGDALLAWGDIVHIASIQFEHPDVTMVFDLDQEMARASRRRILDMAATERLTIAGAHVDAPGLGHVVRRGAGYAFEPA